MGPATGRARASGESSMIAQVSHLRTRNSKMSWYPAVIRVEGPELRLYVEKRLGVLDRRFNLGSVATMPGSASRAAGASESRPRLASVLGISLAETEGSHREPSPERAAQEVWTSVPVAPRHGLEAREAAPYGRSRSPIARRVSGGSGRSEVPHASLRFRLRVRRHDDGLLAGRRKLGTNVGDETCRCLCIDRRALTHQAQQPTGKRLEDADVAQLLKFAPDGTNAVASKSLCGGLLQLGLEPKEKLAIGHLRAISHSQQTTRRSGRSRHGGSNGEADELDAVLLPVRVLYSASVVPLGGRFCAIVAVARSAVSPPAEFHLARAQPSSRALTSLRGGSSVRESWRIAVISTLFALSIPR